MKIWIGDAGAAATMHLAGSAHIHLGGIKLTAHHVL
jgi:hypothetical protein